MKLTRGSVSALPLLLAGGVALAAPPERPLDVRRCAAVEAVKLPARATTWYVRADGGDATACDGKTDRPVRSGEPGRACAFNHPAAALSRMRGSDRLVIAPGQYPVVAPLPPVPAGKAGAPTRVAGTTAGGGALPALRGAGVATVVDLTGGSFVELSCLEITDDAACIDGHTGKLACAPDARSASIGVRLVDAHDVVLRSLDVHGLASSGIAAGRVADVTLEDVRVALNGWAGWNGDVGRDSRNRGRLTFRRVTFEWNGCAEDARGQPAGCWAQGAGGYGDGLGAALTGGSWRFEDSRFLHNTSDGLDLLWHDGDGDIVIDGVWAEGNAGNQLKTRGEVLIRDTVAVGNCGFFARKPFTFFVDPCRAYGVTLALEPLPGRRQRIERSTVTTEGDSLVGAAIPPVLADDRLRAGLPRDVCARLLPIVAEDSIFAGGRFFLDGKPTALYYRECGGLEGAGARFEPRGSVIWNVKSYGLPPEGACAPGTGNLCIDPQLDAQLRPRPGSPAAGRGATAR